MIVYACPDLFFASKIRATADAMKIASRPTRDAQALRNRLEQIDDGRLNEPVTGVVIDLGLGDDALELVRQAKTHSATLPVVAYGSHMATQQLQEARAAGADFVMANSQFTANLEAVLERLR